MKTKMDELESKKKSLNSLIGEIKSTPVNVNVSKEMIKGYILKDYRLHDMNFEYKQRLIQSFIESVSVNSTTIDIRSIVRLNGCGGPYHFNFTPNRK